MNGFFKVERSWALAAISCAALIVGCASVPPPTDQIAVSRLAIANAVQAGGAEYAPVEMTAAQDKMDRAGRAMEKKDYDDARTLAEQAQADARLAEKKAESGKALKSAGVVQEDVRVLREEINRKNK
jgi:multidrug efflux pump subunit AcrA (membrane-fusion protein)